VIGGGQGLAVWGEGYRVDHRALSSVQLAQLFAVVGVPEANCVVQAARSQGLAVGCENHGTNVFRVALPILNLFSGVWLPQPNRLVSAARDQELAVAREGQRKNKPHV